MPGQQFYRRYQNPNEVYFYVEKYCPNKKQVLVDFLDSNEIGFFNGFASLIYAWEQRPTMILINNYSLKPLREGSYYVLAKETIAQIVELGLLSVVEDSLLIGFTINLDNRIESLFGKTKSFNEFERFELNIEQFDNQRLPQLNLKLKGKVGVIVKDVGQGSWNEIIIDNVPVLVFDVGTIWTTKRIDLIAKASTKNIEYQNAMPTLMLSHWDVDHYHYLLGFEDATIASFPYFIYRCVVPNLTVRKVLGRFHLLNPSALISVSPERPMSYGSKSSDRLCAYPITTTNDFLLFNGSKNRSKNKSGFGLIIRKTKRSIVLAGDYDYAQVSDYMLPHLNYNHEHFLVVPHHGGKAGKFNYNLRLGTRLKDAIISVGKNPYTPSHPHRNNIADLRSLGFNIFRTDIAKTDYAVSIC